MTLHENLSVNRLALPLVEKMIHRYAELCLLVEKTPEGTTIIDAGIATAGSLAAGKLLTEICLGGVGTSCLTNFSCGNISLPAIFVATSQPSISLLGSQYAGWQLKLKEYFAMASGPARALALKPKELYEKIGYKDTSDLAVVVLETSKKPSSEVLSLIADECKVTLDKLYVLVAPTASIAGSTQISGRVLEVGLHRLVNLGFETREVISGSGIAPIAPVHPKQNKAMGRTNDMILYGGTVNFTVSTENDDALKAIVEMAPSSTSKEYGKPFAEIFKAAGFDFYKIDPSLFAPAAIIVNNLKTGSVFAAGGINSRALQLSIFG
ncbi:MAG: methenyltetrahydromethanopterin cyclohydrolase [Candidatus Bathyarchaeia archaeon]